MALLALGSMAPSLLLLSSEVSDLSFHKGPDSVLIYASSIDVSAPYPALCNLSRRAICTVNKPPVIVP